MQTQNCAADTDQMLNLIGVSDSNPSTSSEFVEASTTRIILNIPNHDYHNMDLPEENAFEYVCGYLIKKCTDILTCEGCTNYLNENKTVFDNTALYCSFRAYSGTEENPFGNFHVASNNFCTYIQELEKIFVTFENNCFQKILVVIYSNLRRL